MFQGIGYQKIAQELPLVELNKLPITLNSYTANTYFKELNSQQKTNLEYKFFKIDSQVCSKQTILLLITDYDKNKKSFLEVSSEFTNI